MYHVIAEKVKEHDKANLNFEKNSIKFTVILTFINNIVSLLTIVTPFVVFIVGSNMVIKGRITSGTLMSLFSYSGAVFSPIGQLVSLLPLLQQASASIERINNLLTDTKVTRNSLQSHKKKNTKNKIPSICIKDIKYNVGEKKIFNGVNLYLDAPIIFLTGNNGSGKSTLSKLISGVIKPDCGDIQLNDINSVLYIPPDDYLFKGTILDNLTKGLSYYDENELDELVNYLGLDANLSKIDDVSGKLSTGQIQKIKFIRSLISEDNVLIFDEVLSNIDIQTRKKCFRLMQEYCKKKMFIVISHESLGELPHLVYKTIKL